MIALFLKSFAVPTLLILLLAVLRAALGKKIPRRLFCILWQAAVLRLLIPVSFGLPVLPPEELELVQTQTAAVTEFHVLPWKWETLFTFIYILGIVFLALRFCTEHMRTMNRCKFSLPLSVRAGEIKSRIGLKRNVDIRTCEETPTPFTYGIFRPVVILPKGLEGESVRHILAHELVHVRRLDVLWKLLFAIALCIHWVNPAVWLLYLISERDMELTCDDEAVEKLLLSPSAYAMTLISMEERLLDPGAAAFGKKPVRERVERLIGGVSRPAMGAAAGFAAVIIAAAFFTTIEHMPPRVVYVTVNEQTAEATDNIPMTENYIAGESSKVYETDSSGSIAAEYDTALEEAVYTFIVTRDASGSYEAAELAEDTFWEEASYTAADGTYITRSYSFSVMPDDIARTEPEYRISVADADYRDNAASDTVLYVNDYVMVVTADSE